MVIAFISDIHGNLPALEAAVADAKARGAKRIICAGDMTGYGPFPDEVCLFLKEQRIPAIIGNYDQKVIEVAKRGVSAAAKMKQKKRKILLWTLAHLGDQARRYLAGLPENLSLGSPGGISLSFSMEALSPWMTRSIRALPRGVWMRNSAIRARISSCVATRTSLS